MISLVFNLIGDSETGNIKEVEITADGDLGSLIPILQGKTVQFTVMQEGHSTSITQHKFFKRGDKYIMDVKYI